MVEGTHNLILVAWDDEAKTWSDLRQIAGIVSDIDRDVRARAVGPHKRDQIGLMPLWFRPTLSLSMVRKRGRRWLPGRFMTGMHLGKDGEYRRMAALGIPVPEWTVIGPDTRLDPDYWGPYVVEKPAKGRLGAYVKIRGTGRVRYHAPETYPVEHHGRLGPMLAQRFVYTGHWPTSYRVITLFGEVLLCYRQITFGRGQPLTSRWAFGESGGTSIVSNTKDMTIELSSDEEVIALAERAHREAFGDLALLGFDIVRDMETGAVSVLECHAQGSAWMFSSRMGRSIESTNRIDFARQFGAMEKSAAILAKATHRLAAVAPPWKLSPPVLWQPEP